MAAGSSSTADEATLAESLVERCLDVTVDNLTDDAYDRAHVLFRDALGVILGSAMATESSEIVQDMVSVVYGDGEATVAGGGSAPVPAAAFANGTIFHGIELDDTHSGASVHPGAVVIPAVLAVGEAKGATGSEALEAMVAGYECMVRIGRAANPAALYERGFHPTACCGVFGSALAAAKLRGLSEAETVDAVGIAGSFAGGNQEYLAEGVLSKRIQPGHAARSGIIATELASRGYTGPRTILEGDNGFFAAYSDDSDPDALLATIDDDSSFEVTRTGIKPHACCRYNQTPIDAVLDLTEEHDVSVSDIDSITVEIVDAAMSIVAIPHDRKTRPKSSTAAQFSLQYSVAVALIERRAFLEQFREPHLSDPDVHDLIDRITVEHGEDLESYYPDFFPARATVRTTSGEEYSILLKTCRGEPANPLSEAELREKYDLLAERYLDTEDAAALEALATDLPSVADVGEITAYFRG
ncbi:MmgE/PrpD family protein [Natronosalvus halobius]|uniref:MmgE/PrpD family protein n=1 Tax=Natronosalvus halobius TaxID=2953746 RepID=UPI00209CE10B|nr:MmgE/PrpD family protein [Natronosalvus halobius]USZ73595.1 MmgE/PrpD family protein [Natronosalvus halobius]